MRRELEWAAGNKMAESSFLDLRASAAAFSGQLTTAGPLWQQESSLARARGDSTEAALTLLQNAEACALVGLREDAVRLVARAEAESRAPECLQRAAAVLGLADDAAGAERLAEEARRASPDPSSDPETRPLVAALIELRRGRANEAIEALAALRPFEAGPRFGLRPTLVRGLALMQEGRARDAAAEFQRIVDHRSVLALDVIYPVACVHLSRALAAAGDPAGAARARQMVLRFWTHADAGLPLFEEARRVP
jgi:tetratricopeptide (TPR) repeat protein